MGVSLFLYVSILVHVHVIYIMFECLTMFKDTRTDTSHENTHTNTFKCTTAAEKRTQDLEEDLAHTKKAAEEEAERRKVGT